MGGADEVKGLIQLAGGILMGGMALYKLTNVDEPYEPSGAPVYPAQEKVERREKNVEKQTAAPSTPVRKPKKLATPVSNLSWRSTQEVVDDGDCDVENIGSWKSRKGRQGSTEAIEVEKESKESSSVPSTAVPSDTESDEEDDMTPSWMSKKDPQVGVSNDVVTEHSKLAFKLHSRDFAEGVVQNGNESTSHLAYALSDTVFVYPLNTNDGSDYFGKPCADIAHEQGNSLRSAFGHTVDVKKMETRAGAGSAVLGSLLGGSKTTVVTNSESLKYMIPSMFEIAESRLATVFHVATCKINHSTLEISSDFSDVARVRDTGFALLGSGSSQEIFDLGVIAHVAAHKLSTPVLHFFDAVRGLSEFSRTCTAQLKQIAEKMQKSHDNRPASTYGLEAAASPDCPYFASALQKVMRDVSIMLGSGREYKIMEYSGPESPEAVIVAMGTAANTLVQCLHGSDTNAVGVINVRLLRPWSSTHFLEVLPKSVKKICVLDQAGNLSPLFLDVASALHSGAAKQLYSSPILIGGKIQVGGLGFDSAMAHAVVSNVLAERPQSHFTVTEENHPISESARKQTNLSELLVLGDCALAGKATAALAQELGNAAGLQVQQMSSQDPYSFLYRSDLRLGDSEYEMPVGFGVKSADVVVSSESHLETAVASVRTGGSILLSGKVTSLGQEYKASIVRKSINMYSLDLPDITETDDQLWLLSVAALAMSNKEAFKEIFPHVRNALRSVGKHSLNQHAESILDHLVKHGHGFFQPAFNDFAEDGVEVQSISSMSQGTRIPKYTPRLFAGEEAAEEEEKASEDKAEVVPPHEVAWNLIFKETYDTHTALRPAHHDVHFARVTKLERLTPLDYSRNVFHMEFDISSTPIKYQIGDALGVFGHNDEGEVETFMTQYGIHGDEIVRLPRRGALLKTAGNAQEYVSARNLLVQHLDLFGRPSKKFYTALAQYASSRYEYLRLMHIGTDDSESFKLGIHETMNFADILLQYKSARPSIEELATMIPEIKARHYSISSSMKVCPRSVHLLVVAVDWETPLGRKRSGQCTRYLKNLKPGDIVSVDIQQSVLRLPPNPTQPIVMAGLGTGMAPFRAFIQERLWQREAGIKVGPCVLYFGARHKAQEWLYGEELEKYEKMGLVRLGLAWSRDQKNKVYIQHKIKEDGEMLKDLLGDRKGYFYLCGPTWPVPDVRDAIASGLTPEKVSPNGEIDVEVVEELKEDGRYILEVY